MISTFLSLLLYGAWVWHDLQIRARVNASPATWKDLFHLVQKRTTPDRRYSGLAFACGSFLLFASWEGAIRGALDIDYFPLIWLLAIPLWGMAFVTRRASPTRLRQEDVWIGHCAFAAGMGAWLSVLVLGLWVWIRGRFLPRIS